MFQKILFPYFLYLIGAKWNVLFHKYLKIIWQSWIVNLDYELLLAVIADGTKLEFSSAWFVEVEEETKIVKMEPFEVQEHTVSYFNPIYTGLFWCTNWTGEGGMPYPLIFFNLWNYLGFKIRFSNKLKHGHRYGLCKMGSIKSFFSFC